MKKYFILSLIIFALIKSIFSDKYEKSIAQKKKRKGQNFFYKNSLKFSNKKVECQLDSDCLDMNICSNKKCMHKPFIPPTKKELIGFLCLLLTSILSNAAGIGGGELFIPILILILNFEMQEAIPISKIMIFTGSLTSFFIGLNYKHPYKEAIALDYNIGGILIPMILFGSTVGVTLNEMMPLPIILTSLLLVSFIYTYKTFRIAFTNYQLENQEFEEKENEEKFALTHSKNENGLVFDDTEKNGISENENETVKIITDKFNSNQYVLNNDEFFFSNYKTDETDKIYSSLVEEKKKLPDKLSFEISNNFENIISLKEEKRKDNNFFPIYKLKYILLMLICFLLFLFSKGNKNFKSVIGIIPCSATYWIFFINFFPLSLGEVAIFADLILTENKTRMKIGYPFHINDLKWNFRMVIEYQIYGFIGGLLAGFLGIGGGSILGPIFLNIGIHPVISNVTTNFLVLFTSSSTSLQFFLMGRMNLKYGLFCCICSIIGGFLGKSIVKTVIDKMKRPSILIFILATVLGIGTIIIPWDLIAKIKKKIDLGINIWKMDSAC